MANWRDYIEIRGGTEEEQGLVAESYDELWKSPTMRSEIETIPELYRQRIEEYETINGEAYPYEKPDKAVVLLDDRYGINSFPLENAITFSFKQAQSLTFSDSKTGDAIAMSPTRAIGHETLHITNAKETPSNDLAVSKIALQEVFGTKMAQDYPDEFAKIKDDVGHFEETRTSAEVDAVLDDIKGKIGDNVYNSAIGLVKIREEELWTAEVEDSVVQKMDSVMDEVHPGGNPDREHYTTHSFDNIKHSNGTYSVDEMRRRIHEPESAAPAPDDQSSAEPVDATSAYYAGEFVQDLGGVRTQDSFQTVRAADLRETPGFTPDAANDADMRFSTPGVA